MMRTGHSSPARATRRSCKSTRLCVKNIPKHLNDERLREVFSVKGVVTDAKVLRTRDGTSRRIAFVGFATDKDASDARAYFDNTFIDTSRVTVEFAIPVGDVNLPRPWSRYSKGSSRHQHEHPKLYEQAKTQALTKDVGGNEWQRKMAKAADSDEFREFLSVVQPRSKGKFWANDDGVSVSAVSKPSGSDAPRQSIERVESKKPGGRGVFVNTVHDRFDAVDAEDAEQVVFEGDSDDDSDENNVFDARSVAAEKNDDSDEKKNSDSQESIAENIESSITEMPQDELEDGRVFVRNLSYSVREDDLMPLFSALGEVNEVILPLDDVGRSKGFALVQYVFPESAVHAIHRLDGRAFQGRLLHVIPAKRKSDVTKPEASVTEGITFKKQVEMKRKQDSANQKNWNSLFLRSDTVTAAAAQRHGITKGELLDAEADSMAVRVALAETQTIAETKLFFEKNGVSVGAFDGVKKPTRSKTCILVKNLPFDSEHSELRCMFDTFGILGRLLIPESRSVAIVEFLEARNARKAFRALAYKKFKHVPLYLEWAPINLFVKPCTEAEKIVMKSNTVCDELSDDDETIVGSTLFVKNLNFQTVEASLQQKFEGIGKVRSAVVAKRRVKDKMLSCGYGFVEFGNSDSALRALKQLQGTMLDGFSLQLKVANRGATTTNESKTSQRRYDTSSNSKLSKTKLMIKNVPFEANMKEVRELFGTFGQLKSCRIPKKFNGGHRGFAFVEFSTKQQARIAFEALSSTHLYGRKLVLNWAQADKSIDEMRVLASQQLAEGSTPTKRSRINEFVTGET